MAEYPLWAAQNTVRTGMSARAGLAAYRAGGGQVGRTKWFRMVSEVRAAVAAGNDEVMKPLDRRPSGPDINPIETRGATGYLQHVHVLVRNKDTGQMGIRRWSMATDWLETRQDVVDTAIDRFQRFKYDYDEEILGGVYAGTSVYVPEES